MGIDGIPEKMLACQIVEFDKPYKIHEIPSPKALKDWDMLVKVAVGSLCHTDGMVVHGQFGQSLPITASHEGAGTVVALGSGVKDFRAGDRVLCSLTYDRCGTCEYCTGPETQQHRCPQGNLGGLGIAKDGAFAEYEVIDAREACRLPDNLSFQSAAPLACAGATMWGGITTSGLQEGQWLAIVGAGGGLGHLGIQFAKALGLKVIGIDARDEALELARNSGADHVVDARKGKEEAAEEVQRITGQSGADSTLVVSDAPSAAALSAAVTKRHATMVQIAQPDEISVPYQDIIFRDIRIRGSVMASKGEMQKMLDFVAKHDIKVKTNPFRGLKEIPKMLDLVHSGKMAGKGVVLIDEEAIAKEKASGLKMI